MTLKIELEPYSPELFAEILPLAQKCWEESTEFKAESCAFYGDRDFQIEPDLDTYARLARLELLTLVTLRTQGKLVGYLTGFIHKALHHKHIQCAVVDSVYIEPSYRVYGPVVAERFEKEMVSKGVQVISWPVHPNGPIHEVLKTRGYVGDDVVMEKRLCAS